ALAGWQPGLWRTGRPCGRGRLRIAEKPPTVAFPSVIHRNHRRRTSGAGGSGAGVSLPAGDGLDGQAAVPRHHLDDPVQVTRLEQIHHPLVVMARLVDVDKAGNSVRSGDIPQIGEEAKQPVTAGPAEGDEMELAI